MPGQPWHTLWYAAVALVVMVVVIASGHLLSLNFVHVFSGLLWTGIDLFMVFVLGPILRVIDISARKSVLLRLTPRTLFLMPTLSIITGTTGWFLAKDLGLTGLNWPQYAWVAAALALVVLMAIQARIPAAHEFAGLPGAAREQPRPDQDCQANQSLFHGRRIPGRYASGDHRPHGTVRDGNLNFRDAERQRYCALA